MCCCSVVCPSVASDAVDPVHLSRAPALTQLQFSLSLSRSRILTHPCLLPRLGLGIGILGLDRAVTLSGSTTCYHNFQRRHSTEAPPSQAPESLGSTFSNNLIFPSTSLILLFKQNLSQPSPLSSVLSRHASRKVLLSTIGYSTIRKYLES